jgi:hypothetical protein
MKRIWALVIVGMCVESAFGAVCDATYHLQGVTQTVIERHLTETDELLSSATSELDASLGGARIIDTAATYKVLKQFTPVCGDWTTGPVTYWKRPPGSNTSFADESDNSLYYRVFDTLFQVTGCPRYSMSVAFKLKPDTNVIAFVVGRTSLETPFYQYYATAILHDTARSAIGEWSYTGAMRYLQLSSGCDSAALVNGLVQGLKGSRTYGAELHGYLVIQVLRATYDSTAAAVRSAPGNHPGITTALRRSGDHETVIFDVLGREVVRSRADALRHGELRPGYYIVRQRLRNRTIEVGGVETGR